MSFYGSGLGDRLVDASLFPVEIKEFLREEELMLASASSRFDLLVEVGCMYGRYLDWAIAHGKAYAGVDVVARYIELGRARAGELSLPVEKYHFILGEAETVDTLLRPELMGIARSRTLLFFPFNSFGNMRSCYQVVDCLNRAQMPFLVSTYLTTPSATACRERYYESCSYKGLEMTENDQGFVFRAKGGLRSMAYHPDFLLGVFASAGVTAETTCFAQIGISYSTPGIFAANANLGEG